MQEFLDNIWKMIVESNVLHLIWALLILLVGWLLAVVISNRAGIILRNWGVAKSSPIVCRKGRTAPPCGWRR